MKTRFDPKFAKVTLKHGGGNVKTWGCFSGHGVGPVKLIEGNRINSNTKMYWKIQGYLMLKTCFQLFGYSSTTMIQSEQCSVNGTIATCVHLKECPSALRDVKLRKYPQLCRFQGIHPIVCCADPKPNYLDTIRSSEKETKDAENGDGVVDLLKYNGTKSIEHCLEYAKLIFWCDDPASGDDCRKIDLCPNVPGGDKVTGGGGVDAYRMEFPHMALLGYGNDVRNLKWLCGGTLISENFILTAAHCTSTNEGDSITYAAMGLLKRSDPEEYWKKYRIKRIITHPQYRPPAKYHDIALLETEIPVKLNISVMPGCLDVGHEMYDSAFATGWGALGPTLDNADILQKIPLLKVSAENCSLKYPPHRHTLRGYDHATQMCYGDDGIPRDTCSGDSGGPLQAYHNQIYCMYNILGVTSFGKSCLQLGEPGIYTRVSYYVPWIESIVWP